MHVFYAPGISGTTHILDEKESRHCIKVLRMKKWTPVKLIDGNGNLYDGIIQNPDPAGCLIEITNITKDFQARPYKLHLAVSPLKNPERFDWMVEKCVEIGVDEITPVICANTEKRRIRADRINNIIISAMKQSLKAVLTILNPAIQLSDFIAKNYEGTRLIAHCYPSFHREPISKAYNKGEDAIIMIGPEGDFSEDEIQISVNAGFIPVHLGTSRLRTETAGIAACHSVYFINQ